jgi:hypothetical protein
MKLFFTILFLFAMGSVACSKLPMPGRWSFMAEGGFSIPVSSSMNGNEDDLYDFSWAHTFNNYPFGDETAYSYNGGGQIAYRLAESPWSVFAADHYSYSYMDNGYEGVDNEYVSFLINSISFGSDYTLGKHTEPINVFGRCAIAVSFIRQKLSTITSP